MMIEHYPWMDRLSLKAQAQAKEDLKHLNLRCALAWPTEARPTPVPFQWGEYDRVAGNVEPGTYWDESGEPLTISRNPNGNELFRAWLFAKGSSQPTTNPRRGPLYRTRREALVAKLWAECDRAAERLLTIHNMISEEESGE